MKHESPNFRRGALTEIAENVWIVNDAPISAAGLRLPIRMTVLRLKGDRLLLHSPTRYDDDLHDQLKRLGALSYLFAPNVAHWMFLPQWRQAAPDARLWAAPGLGARAQVRRSGLRIDRELDENTPQEWAEEVETALVSAPLFAEVALFHRPTRTLVLTDLVQNLRADRLPLGSRLAAHALGVAAPEGRAPLYLRALLRLGGRAAALAGARLIDWAPERVVFAHGEWFESDATARLRRSLHWLVAGTEGEGAAATEGRPPARAIARLAGYAGVALFTFSALAVLRGARRR